MCSLLPQFFLGIMLKLKPKQASSSTCTLCPEIFMHNCVNNEFPWSVHWYAYGLGKISFCDARNFGHKMKELEQWWQKWGRFHHLSTPPKIQTVENIMLYMYKYYTYICICVVKLIWVTGKNAKISVWSEKNWTRIISQNEINHVGILKDSPLIIGNSQDGFYPNENRWGDFLLFWMIMMILTIVPRHKVWVCRHFFPWSDLEG